MPGTSLVWLNGRLLEPEQARVRVADRGFLFGDGLFETMRARGTRVFRLGAHINRLSAGARRLDLPVPAGIETAIARLLEAARLDDSALRLTLTRGLGDEGLEPPPGNRPTFAVSARPLPEFPRAWYQEGLAIRTARHRQSSRSATAGIKALGYLPNLLALREARAGGADDALVLDDRDRLASLSTANLFWVGADGVLRTPSPACAILAGVTRAAAMELALARGLHTQEGEWATAELAKAREAFATSSLRGVVPITTFDGAPVGSGRPGDLTRHLMTAYEELVLRETTTRSRGSPAAR